MTSLGTYTKRDSIGHWLTVQGGLTMFSSAVLGFREVFGFFPLKAQNMFVEIV